MYQSSIDGSEVLNSIEREGGRGREAKSGVDVRLL